MNIALSPALRRFVDDQVKNGRYLDSGEVVREALPDGGEDARWTRRWAGWARATLRQWPLSC